jgi:hypothetical protein
MAAFAGTGTAENEREVRWSRYDRVPPEWRKSGCTLLGSTTPIVPRKRGFSSRRKSGVLTRPKCCFAVDDAGVSRHLASPCCRDGPGQCPAMTIEEAANHSTTEYVRHEHIR